jgi:outer membrane lipoprotein SlyB
MWCTNFKTNKKIFRYEKISIVAMATIMVIGSIFTSCEAVKIQIKRKRGAGIGAVAGAVLGGVLGTILVKGGNGAVGAVLGGVIGGVAGGVIGNKTDKQERN